MKKISFSIFPLILLTVLSTLFTSCFGIAKMHARKEFTEELHAIPPHFGEKGTVLIAILRNRSSYDNYVKKAAKLYNGEVILLKNSAELTTLYSDKTKYRFLFDYTAGSTSSVHYAGSNLNSSVTYKRFYVSDRLENEMYQCGYESGSFGDLLKAYFENLEKKRLSMQ